MNNYIFTLSIIFLLYNCGNNNLQEAGPKIEIIPSPSTHGGESNLFVSETEQVYLSWVEYLNDSTDALLFSKLEDNQWSSPIEIARGNNWFVNWADFPSFVAYPDDGASFATHWLQKSAEGTYDYDIHISQSSDGGTSWGASFVPHKDSIPAEHGFVTMFPISEKRIFATWLDGRNTKAKENATEHNQHGAMTLRTAEFDRAGNLFEEYELDNRICDCCQTDAVLSAAGPVVVYRDRSPSEIRDISIARKVNGDWLSPRTIHDDHWKIAGCPVNGPAIDAIENTVAVAWFTAPEGKAMVKVAFSEDSGATFSKPIRVDDGQPAGRVDIILLSQKEALVTWLENNEEIGEIRAVKVSPKHKLGTSMLLAETSLSRSSGFPIMAKAEDNIYLSWTKVDSLTKVQTAILKFF